MPSIKLYTSTSQPNNQHATTNPLPQLLQTPSGLAILELQGTIHAPFPLPSSNSIQDSSNSDSQTQTSIGRLEFPFHNPTDTNDKAWMKKVYLYIGKHQRMTGEVKTLGKPLAVVAKREVLQSDRMDIGDSAREEGEVSELEIRGIVRYKLVFSARPEPVSAE